MPGNFRWMLATDMDRATASAAAAGGAEKRAYVKRIFSEIAPRYDLLNHVLSLNIDRYRPEFKFSSWLFKIANNITIDHLRRRQVDTISIEGSPDAITAERARATAVTVTSGGESPLEELESRELGAEIEKAIAKLRPEYRACIILRHVEDYSYDEIAEIVKLPLGTVKTYIHRARQELRQYLGDLR